MSLLYFCLCIYAQNNLAVLSNYGTIPGALSSLSVNWPEYMTLCCRNILHSFCL